MASPSKPSTARLPDWLEAKDLIEQYGYTLRQAYAMLGYTVDKIDLILNAAKYRNTIETLELVRSAAIHKLAVDKPELKFLLDKLRDTDTVPYPREIVIED